MALLARVPPGRAGRMWLRRRLGTAERGRDQLDRKLRILAPELQRLRGEEDRRRSEWAAAYAEADTWLLRTVLLGGQDVIRHAGAPELARVELVWTTAMGFSYPSDATVVTPAENSTAAPGNAATAPAVRAFQDAVLAGVRVAAAQEAVRRLEAEVAVTRQRLRALEKRWLPLLHEALAALELSLEQAEQEDGVRLRRAAAGRPLRGPSP